MKKKSLIILLSVIVVLGGGLTVWLGAMGKAEKKPAGPAADVAFNFQATNVMNGAVVRLSDYKGKAVLLNVFDTWCPPCRMEIPDLIQLSENYKSNFTVIGVVIGQEGMPVVKSFVKDQKITYPVILLNEGISRNYTGITGIPTSFLVDKQGNMAGKIVGYRNYNQYVTLITPLIQ